VRALSGKFFAGHCALLAQRLDCGRGVRSRTQQRSHCLCFSLPWWRRFAAAPFVAQHKRRAPVLVGCALSCFGRCGHDGQRKQERQHSVLCSAPHALQAPFDRTCSARVHVSGRAGPNGARLLRLLIDAQPTELVLQLEGRACALVMFKALGVVCHALFRIVFADVVSACRNGAHLQRRFASTWQDHGDHNLRGTGQGIRGHEALCGAGSKGVCCVHCALQPIDARIPKGQERTSVQDLSGGCLRLCQVMGQQ
jgi:hypothetical protein